MRLGAWFVKCNIAIVLRIMYIMLNYEYGRENLSRLKVVH
jgi:hypothetical protein